jgi:hypothetical protein
VTVPEGMNVEVAHSLSEEHEAGRKRRWEEVVEIVEVLVLAVVAVATAWSGYQAARWDGQQSLKYGESSRLRFQADAASTRGGQVLLGDSSFLNGWLQAHATGDEELEDLFARRFSPEYQVAFQAWLGTHPFTNDDAPPGPAAMPDYRNPDFAEASKLNDEASSSFAEGTEARETAEDYVRDTVLFATVLFLVALAQRFKIRAARLASGAVAIGVLVFTLESVTSLPRL